MSLEEKATRVECAHQRAVLQLAYEDLSRDIGQIPTNFDIDHPLVELIGEALEAWQYQPELRSDGNVSSPEELLNESWFDGYQDRLDNAIKQTRALYDLDA